VKYEIGKFIRNFGSNLAKKKNNDESNLICKISSLLTKMVLSDAEKVELTHLQKALDEVYKQKAEGAFVRSRKKWIEEGEQNSSYFFRLERQQMGKNQIEKLMIDGNLCEDQRTIANFCAKFYRDLYTSKFSKQHAHSFFESLSSVNQLENTDQIFCDSPITLKEIEEAIKSLKTNKSPGTDGLTSEFYHVFSEIIAPFLLNVFKESLNNSSLPPTLCQGLITLIPKSNKNTTFIDNWRPITLLNNDYKIIALVLAKRLKGVLHSIIDETQSGFMQNRHISNNIRLILDILDYSDIINNDSFILFLDYYKAFDTLEHSFLFQALKKIGFGDSFCKMVKMLYVNGSSSIKLKSGTSPRFFLDRGVRQGCPVSPYLFLIDTFSLVS